MVVSAELKLLHVSVFPKTYKLKKRITSAASFGGRRAKKQVNVLIAGGTTDAPVRPQRKGPTGGWESFPKTR